MTYYILMMMIIHDGDDGFFLWYILKESWFKGDMMKIIETALQNGGEPNKSDAFTIHGQPGDLYDCSKQGN